MSIQVDLRIKQLVDYAVRKRLICEEDRAYVTNGLLSALGRGEYVDVDAAEPAPLEDILSDLCDYAAENGIIENNTVVFRDLFDTKLMGVLTPRPSEVIKTFSALYTISPKAATDYFYRLCIDSDYIREYRVSKDMKWIYSGDYGDLDITINLCDIER